MSFEAFFKYMFIYELLCYIFNKIYFYNSSHLTIGSVNCSSYYSFELN